MDKLNKKMRDEAEGDLIDLVRRNDEQNFTLTITCRNGQWYVECKSLDPERDRPDLTLKGDGRSFPEAWQAQAPLWALKED